MFINLKVKAQRKTIQLYNEYVKFSGSYVPKNSMILDFKRYLKQQGIDITSIEDLITFTLFNDYYVNYIESDPLLNQIRYAQK